MRVTGGFRDGHENNDGDTCDEDDGNQATGEPCGRSSRLSRRPANQAAVYCACDGVSVCGGELSSVVQCARQSPVAACATI